jgi:hypothetical protein
LLRERGLKLRGGELALLDQQISQTFLGDGGLLVDAEVLWRGLKVKASGATVKRRVLAQ